MKLFKDYIWKEGIPNGVQPFTQEPSFNDTSFKIVADPYRKWISIEEYHGTTLKDVIYDSSLFDFRSLKPMNQIAWEKFSLSETKCMIRNQDDRVILVEEYHFEKGYCRLCTVSSVHGLPISTQKMLYKSLGDTENGVTLYDNRKHPVMKKIYAIDEETVEFTELLEENWNLYS